MTHPDILAHRQKRIEMARTDPSIELARNDEAPPCLYCEQPGDWKYRYLSGDDGLKYPSPWYCLCGFRVGAEW